MSEFRGYISRQHTVWCGACGNWEQGDIPTLATFKKSVRKSGWKDSKVHGWRCPKCLENHGKRDR